MPTHTHPPTPTHPSGLVDGYSLADLQAYLQQYPAAHYSHGGKEPLLYVVVLLLSLQFRCGPGRGWAGSGLSRVLGCSMRHCRRSRLPYLFVPVC